MTDLNDWFIYNNSINFSIMKCQTYKSHKEWCSIHKYKLFCENSFKIGVFILDGVICKNDNFNFSNYCNLTVLKISTLIF